MITGRVGCSLATGRAPRWVFVVGRAFLVAVPATASQDVVDRLTAVVARDSIEIETLVSLIPLSGCDAVQNFVALVVSEAAETARSDDGVLVSAVIRGAIVADIYSIGGSRRFSDSDIRPWLLADFQSVIGVVISDPDAAVLPAAALGGVGVSVEAGVMPGQALYWLRAGGAAEAAGPPESEPESERASELAPDAALSSSTVLPSPQGVDASATAQVPELALTLTQAPIEGDTVLRAPARSRPVDADTVLSRPVDEVETELGLPASFRAPETDPETAPVAEILHSTFHFTVQRKGRSTRRQFDLSAPCLVGRRPSAPRVSDGADPQLVTVDSPSAAVSRTHLEIRQVGDSVVVTDLGSTNGTHVVSLTGITQRLQPRGSLTVLPGMRVDIGDGNIIQILPVDAASLRPPAHPHSERRHL